MAEAFLGLGGNVGDVRTTFDRAVDLLCRRGDVRLTAESSDYRTPPWGVVDQPAFINRCIGVQTDLPPRDLLERALRIESLLGRDRRRQQRWGPRPLDIDLLTYDVVVLDEPGLRLPHPHVLKRAFVLVPLAEIARDRLLGGIRVCDALGELDTRGIERLPARQSGG